jgi:hypothetical protein
MLGGPVKYLLLVANAPDAWDDTDARPAEGVDDGVITDWAAYTRALHDAGVLVGGQATHTPDTATSVQVRQGRRLLVDGPFADTKEHLIGYYVIEVPDLDTALDWAARVPNARTGTIEVRPLQEGSDTATVLATGRAPGSA